ncbi:helix-turn-helix transcriptional regulator [Roseateles sp. LYH14W]|uniref:Helix-turn-helix transcriptional regulator n=1 Tax=Pelomonas parva TaxID=3299032 RepID=A0ABW7EY08_9BURK
MTESFAPAWPCILLDGQLAAAQINPAALRLLAANEPVLCLRRQRLHAPGDPLALGRCLAAAARGERSALALARPGRPALTLLAEPLPTDGLDWVRVCLRDPELELPDPRLLQSLFGFTPTEAVVAAGLAQGMDSAELARTLGVQPNTVHSHIKRVLLKSGARRQSRLVSLILRSVAMLPHPLLAGAACPPGPGLAQTGNDAGQGAGHSPPQPLPAACACN